MEKNNIVQRSLLKDIRDAAVNHGFRPQDVRPHILKVYGELKKNQKGIVFVVEQKNKSGVLDTEILLQNGDMFFANAVGVAIHKVILDANQKTLEGNTPLIYYPDPDVFTQPAAAGGVLKEHECLEMLYNAKMFIQTDQDIRIDGLSTTIFRTVPQTQYTATPNNLPNYSGVETKDISTSMLFFGDRSNTVKLDFPNGDYSAIEGNIAASGYKNYAVLLLEGFTVVGGANNARVWDFLVQK